VNNLKKSLAVLAVLVGLSSMSYGMEVINNDKGSMNIGGRIQEVAYGELVHDPYKDNARVYLFLKQARFRVNGKLDAIKYDFQWVGAAEDVNGSNAGLTLLDAAFDVPLFNWESTWFKVGQFKVPYSRESISEEGNLQFVSPSIDFLGFNLGRDYGAAIHSYQNKFVEGFGVFSGGARDVPLRFLPERLGVPMLVTRLGYNDGVDKDLFTSAQNDLKPVRVTKATYINAMYMKDTRIGHSTVLNSRTSEKSLLMNSNWNPYLNYGASTQTANGTNNGGPNTLDRGEFWQIGWDAAARGPMGQGAWSAEVELNYAQYENKYGKAHLNGARVQGAVSGKHLEFGLRYALMALDNNLLARNSANATYSTAGTKISNGKPIQEIVPVFSYYIRGHDHKVVLDFPILVNVPVFIENNQGNKAGAYVGTEQPDQTSVIAGSRGRLEYQTVTQARLMYQLAF
jgi:Phosphate-selective porin O and P